MGVQRALAFRIIARKMRNFYQRRTNLGSCRKYYDSFIYSEENTEELRISNLKNKEEKKVSIEDFRLLKVLGKGSFGKVMLVQYKPKSKLKFYKNRIIIRDEGAPEEEYQKRSVEETYPD
jgi:hypothetical protein